MAIPLLVLVEKAMVEIGRLHVYNNIIILIHTSKFWIDILQSTEAI